MKLTKRVIQLEYTKGSYAYAIINNGVTLIDSGLPGKGKAILSELKSYGIMPNEIKSLLLTHHDIDHIGNVCYLQEQCHCEVYISATDLPYAMGTTKRDGIKKVLGTLMKAPFPAGGKGFDSRIINGIEIIEAPGHTRGHTCFRFNDVFFAGDLLRSKSGKLALPPKIMTWDMKKNIDSCKGIHFEGVQWICPAHGEPVPGTAWSPFIETLK